MEGLMDEEKVLQIISSREYSRSHVYYDKVSEKLKNAATMVEAHDEWKDTPLCARQMKAFELLSKQTRRNILWVHEPMRT